MSKLSELLAAAKARTTPSTPSTPTVIAESIQSIGSIQEGENHHYGIGKNGESIEYNAEQWAFIQLVLGGKSCVLIGAAGTGKTTSTRGAIETLLQTKHIPQIDAQHKHLPADTPAIVFISYTRRAVMNLRKAVPSELASNCITIHKLLEYAPVFYEVFDEVAGEYKKTMKFEPSRNRYNPLPPSIRTIIIDESSMVSVALYAQILDALGENRLNVQFIFLGDIQQLPPVFGSAILGYKMLSLPVIELTQVYRQALESPIIRLAHRILSGVPILLEEMASWNVPDKLKLHPWKKKISSDSALLTVAAFFKQSYDKGVYNTEEDMILIPFNKACGTDELNKHIANHIARRKGLVTYEVIAGYNKHYFSEGDKILYEKEDAILVGIKRNPVYAGKWPQSASTKLDYWGCLQELEDKELEHHVDETESEDDVDRMLELMGSDVEDRVREASHILTIRLLDSDRELEVKTASEINNLIMAYALTVHKSQGSEWKRVFLILHQSHNTMIQRELLYTGCTRAREELYVICEPDSFTKGINGQRIKGNTLKEKSEFFKGKVDAGEESLLSIIQ
jgi:exodeoxyribonuclease V alpha subunit